MNNKLIFLIVVLALLFGLIFIISKNRNAREKLRMEEKIRSERQHFVQDSLEKTRTKNAKTKSGVEGVKNTLEVGGTNRTKIEDLSSYINTSITNLSGKTNIAVTVFDEYGNISSSISSSIANAYNQTGNFGKTGLIKSSFFHNSGFQKLFEGNSEIIDKLNLKTHTDYVAIGKICYTIRKGTLVDDTYVCTVSLTMNIISVNLKSLSKSFTCSANGNGATEDQAKECAIQKLLNNFTSEYSTI